MRDEQAIKQLLQEWREAKAVQFGLLPSHPYFCARHSIILHDIYIDSIARNASSIRSFNDLRLYCRYWKWIDVYGQDLFDALTMYLERPKRCRESEADLVDLETKRVRSFV